MTEQVLVNGFGDDGFGGPGFGRLLVLVRSAGIKLWKPGTTGSKITLRPLPTSSGDTADMFSS